MGKQMQDKHSDSYWDSHHSDCSCSLFHIIKRHHWRHFIKRYRRDGGERSAAGTVPARRNDAFSADKKEEHNLAETRKSNVEEKVALSSSVAKKSVRRLIKEFIIREISKKRRHHRRSSTCPILSQSIYTTSTHDLQPSNVDSFAETVLTDGSIMICPDARDTLDRMPLAFSEESSTSTERGVECNATPTDGDWMAVDSKPKPVLPDRPDNVVEKQEASMDSLKVAETTENAQKVEILSKQLDYEIPHLHVDTRDKDDFNYVRYVLEISGLTGNECLSAWHSIDQPVDPLLYEEMEGDADFCSYAGVHCNHHILFDLINEASLEIYGRSYSYCPMPLSSLSHIRPMPVGCHTLHEVWTRMSRSLCLRSKTDQTTDDHVSRDLSRRDGWVNFQLYAEFVGLELEDLIFHDLLEEIMWDLCRACF